MKNIGFLFDLDGVLIDSEREYTRIWNQIENMFPTGIENFALSIKGQTLKKILDDNYSEDVKVKVKDVLHQLEREMHYTYCPGAEELLANLKRQQCNIAVVTSSDETKMNHLYEDLPSFKNYIGLIIDASKVTWSKPHPEGYLLGAERMGIDPHKCVVFEDSVQGVKAGRCSGAYVVGITGTKTREELLPFSDMVIDTLSEINLDHLQKTISER